MNSFSFAERADYLAAKGSSGSIYAALQGATGVSASTVSFIQATGETLIDAMNVFVDAKMGDIGDTLYYITTTDYTGFKWLKSKADYSATSYGQIFYREALIPSSYVEVGVLISRVGNVGLIMRDTEQRIAWCPQAYESETVPGVTTYGGSNNKVGDGTACTYCSYSRAYAEERWGNSPNQYAWSFPKTAWDAMMARVWANASGPNTGASVTAVTSTSGNPKTNGWLEVVSGAYALSTDTSMQSGKTYYTGYSWTVTPNTSTTTGGVGTASFICTGPYGGLSCNPKDYHYDFEEWYKKKVLIQWPTSANVAGDFEGRANTKSIVKWANGLSTPLTTSNCAAKYCNDSVAATGVPGYTAGNWWLSSMGEVLNVGRYHKQLKAKNTAFLSTINILSSTQSTGYNIWTLRGDGFVGLRAKNNENRVCAVSDFQF